MRTTNKGWDSCGHAHARVEGAWQSLWACDGTTASHDQQQAAPVAQAPLAPLTQAGLARPQDASGALQGIPATWANGSDRAAAVAALETGGCEPSSAPGRQRPHGPPAEAPEPSAPVPERRAATVQTPAGQA